MKTCPNITAEHEKGIHFSLAFLKYCSEFILKTPYTSKLLVFHAKPWSSHLLLCFLFIPSPDPESSMVSSHAEEFAEIKCLSGKVPQVTACPVSEFYQSHFWHCTQSCQCIVRICVCLTHVQSICNFGEVTEMSWALNLDYCGSTSMLFSGCEEAQSWIHQLYLLHFILFSVDVNLRLAYVSSYMVLNTKRVVPAGKSSSRYSCPCGWALPCISIHSMHSDHSRHIPALMATACQGSQLDQQLSLWSEQSMPPMEV